MNFGSRVATRQPFDALEWLRRHAPPPTPLDRYRISREQAATSPLFERIAFMVGRTPLPPAPPDRPIRVLQPPAGVLAGLQKIWADSNWVTHQGPAVMTGPDRLLRHLRDLADEIFLATAAGTWPLVEPLPPSEDLTAITASLYPDAPLVTAGEPGPIARLGRLDADTAGRQADPPAVAPGLVVILGCARSGTTWLSTMLQAHPEIGGIDDAESWVFHLLSPLWRNPVGDLAVADRVGRAATASAIRRFVDRLMVDALAQRDRPGAALFVEKTPTHVHHLDLIRAAYPDARFVHIVRDGREVARSLHNTPMAGYPKMGLAASTWRDSVRTVRASRVDAFEVHYEDLVADPVGQVAHLFDWLGIERSGPVDERVRRAAGRRVSTWSLTEGDAHRLRARDLAPVYAEAGDLLVEEGYLSRRRLAAWWLRPSYAYRRWRVLGRDQMER